MMFTPRVARALQDARTRLRDAAAAAHSTASAESNRSARALESQLRTAERQLDRIEDHRARRDSRAEQRRNDDLTARRRTCD